MSRYQRGHIYEAFEAFHVRFYQTELRGGQLTRVQKSHRLCAKDRKHYSAKSKPVQLLCDDFMRKVPVVRINGNLRFRKSDVEMWLENLAKEAA
jgi:hypothetical protein